MMNDDINLNDERLYIPSGVKSQKEVFEGYPVANCIKVGISWIVLGAVMFLLFLVNTRNPGFPILGMIGGIALSLMIFRRGVTNTCFVDLLVILIDFSKTQKKYTYRYLDEWIDEEKV